MSVAELVVMLAFTLPISFLPGPNNLLSAAHSSRYGFKDSLPLISGMVIGWLILGAIVAYGALFIEENQNILNGLTYIGVLYIIYLSYHISTSHSVENENISDEKLNIGTGIMLQIVNGKAFIHLLILMTTFGTIFGTSFTSKMIIVALNVGIKLIGWMGWGLFGSALKEKFSDEASGILINRIFGFSLFCVAIWILLPK
jgi:threonine/homoserine/homoserine lactone efflux protein